MDLTKYSSPGNQWYIYGDKKFPYGFTWTAFPNKETIDELFTLIKIMSKGKVKHRVDYFFDEDIQDNNNCVSFYFSDEEDLECIWNKINKEKLLRNE